MKPVFEETPTVPTATPGEPGREAEQTAGGMDYGLKKLILMLLVAAAILSAVHFTPIGDSVHDLQSLRERLDDGGGFGNELKFVGVATLLIAFGAPRLLFYALAGLVFGLLEGLIAAQAASLIGSYAAFRFFRWGGRDWISRLLGQTRFFKKITSLRPTVFSVFLVRQLPVGNIALNAAFALGPVCDRSFLIGSFLGFIPQGLIAVLIGSGASSDVWQHGLIRLVSAAACIIVLGLGVWHWRRGRSAEDIPGPTA